MFFYTHKNTVKTECIQVMWGSNDCGKIKLLEPSGNIEINKKDTSLNIKRSDKICLAWIIIKIH